MSTNPNRFSNIRAEVIALDPDYVRDSQYVLEYCFGSAGDERKFKAWYKSRGAYTEELED